MIFFLLYLKLSRENELQDYARLILGIYYDFVSLGKKKKGSISLLKWNLTDLPSQSPICEFTHVGSCWSVFVGQYEYLNILNLVKEQEALNIGVT